MSKVLVDKICQALSDKKANNIEIIDLTNQSVIADYFVICDGTSSTLVKTLADNVEEELEKEGTFVLRKEGYAPGRWVVLDYGDVIVHIFLDEERSFYNIEKLWASEDNLTVYED